MIDKLAEVQHKLSGLFDYTPDKEQFGRSDYWTSLKDGVDKGERVKGDCDDYANTAAEMLTKDYQVDPADLRVTIARTSEGETHMLLAVDDKEDGNTKIIDNRMDGVQSWSAPNYNYLASMRLSEHGTWRMMGEDVPLPIPANRQKQPDASAPPGANSALSS